MGAPQFVSFPVDPLVDLAVLGDVLAWAPWRTGDVTLVTRNEVLEKVVAVCRARKVRVGDRPKQGLKAAMGHLAGLGWVSAEYGAGVCALALSKAARVQQLANEKVAELDRLTELALAWGLPIIVINDKARSMSWDATKVLVSRDPQPLSAYWLQLLDQRAGASGFAQSDVTKAAIALCGTRPEAETFRREPPLDSLVFVAHAHRLDYLNAKFLRELKADADRQAVQRLMAALQAAIPAPVQIARPRERERFLGPAPDSEQSLLWNGPLAGELAHLEELGAAHARRRGLSKAAAERVVEKTSRRLRNVPDKGTLSGWWWRILKEEIRNYLSRTVPTSGRAVQSSADTSNDWTEWVDAVEDNRNFAAPLDQEELDRSEVVRDRAVSYMRERATQSLEWALALTVLGPAEQLTAGAKNDAEVMVRVRQFLDPKFTELGIAPRAADRVTGKVLKAMKEALMFALDEPEHTQ